MAVTHADLAITRTTRSLAGKLPTSIFLLCAFLGLLSFLFGFVAEITRTEAVWVDIENSGTWCMYSSDGWSPLVSALCSLLSLTMAVVVGQAFLWFLLCRVDYNHHSPILSAWTDFDNNHYKSLRWLAAASSFFAWICLGLAGVLVGMGIVVEGGHVKRWGVARKDCREVKEGVFAAGGVLALISSSMGVAFYICAVQTERKMEKQANIRVGVMEDASPAHLSMEQLPQSPLPQKDINL